MSEEVHNSRNREFFRLYGQCQNSIFSILFMLVHNEADAEDLLQDTAATMLERFDQYEQGTNFRAWAMTIARNKALNFLKRNSRVRPLLNSDIYERIAELEIREDEQFSERASALQKCFNKLEATDRNILQMRYQQDYSMKKISELLGRSKTGIYHTMARIHSLLYRCVKARMSGGHS